MISLGKHNYLIVDKSELSKLDSTETSDWENYSDTSTDTSENKSVDSSNDEVPQLMSRDEIPYSSSSDEDDKIA